MGSCQKWVPVCWSIKGNSLISLVSAGEALVTAVLWEIRQVRFCVKLLNLYVLWMARTQTALLLLFCSFNGSRDAYRLTFLWSACASRLVIFYFSWSIQHRCCDRCCKTNYWGPWLTGSPTGIRMFDTCGRKTTRNPSNAGKWMKVKVLILSKSWELVALLKVWNYKLKVAFLSLAAWNKTTFEGRKTAGTCLFTLRGRYLTLRLSLKGQVTPNLIENSIEGKRFYLSHWAQSSHIISVTITFPWPSWGYMSPRGVENARTMLWPLDCPEYRRASDIVPISDTQPDVFCIAVPFVVNYSLPNQLWTSIIFIHIVHFKMRIFAAWPRTSGPFALRTRIWSSKHHRFITFITSKEILVIYNMNFNCSFSLIR